MPRVGHGQNCSKAVLDDKALYLVREQLQRVFVWIPARFELNGFTESI